MEKFAAYLTLLGFAWDVFSWIFPYTAVRISDWFKNLPGRIWQYIKDALNGHTESSDEHSDDGQPESSDEHSDDSSDSD